MKRLIRLAVAIGAFLGLSALVAPIAAGADGVPQGAPSFEGGANHVVFVQTDNTAGNQIAAYDRSNSGSLSLAGTYNTGGLGGVLNGSQVDHLASQGSLVYSQTAGSLYAVNAGSNTISVFSVLGDHLSLRQLVSSGGVFPVSVAVHGDLVYVLNSGERGKCSGLLVTLWSPVPTPRLVSQPGLDNPHGRQPVHPHAWASRLYARWYPAGRDHQGQHQRHRCLPPRLLRRAVAHACG